MAAWEAENLFTLYKRQLQTVSIAWWRHQMETLYWSLWGNPPVISGFLSQRPVTRSFNVFFELRLNKQLHKQPSVGDLRRHGSHWDNGIVTSVW